MLFAACSLNDKKQACRETWLFFALIWDVFQIYNVMLLKNYFSQNRLLIFFFWC